jgi:transposase-like protein
MGIPNKDKGKETTPWGERSGGERSEAEQSDPQGAARDEASLRPVSPPDPEVTEKAVRRRFTAKYKLEILKEADRLKNKPGEIGELLRREGLYSSHLSTWRKQRDEGTLRALSGKKRGRKKKKSDPLERRVKEVERENRKLRRKLEQAETIIEIQKKVAALLGIPLDTPGSGEND